MKAEGDPDRLRDDLRWAVRALRQRATCEGNYVLNRRRRWWYTVKVVACILLRREDRSGSRWSDDPDPVEVAYGGWHRTYHPEFGEGADGEVLRVGWGVRHGWRFSVLWTGWP